MRLGENQTACQTRDHHLARIFRSNITELACVIAIFCYALMRAKIGDRREATEYEPHPVSVAGWGGINVRPVP